MRADRGSVLIGVDGGATEVKAHEVEIASDQPELSLRLGRWEHRQLYPRVPGFVPRPLDMQRAQMPEPLLSVPEFEQGLEWIAATAECIERIALASGASSARVGIAMPGVKTPDRRGIALSLHGPRIPDFLDRLEERLASAKVRLCAPLQGLFSDGACCGLGEEHASQGLFRGVRNAYYIGGGTGVAEALKLENELVEWERVETWLPKAWQLRSGTRSFDARLSIAGLNERYAALPPPRHRHRTGGFLEERLDDDPCAREELGDLAWDLWQLIRSRIRSLALRDPNASELPGPIHLQRIVLGQRLGQLHADSRTRPFLALPLERRVERMRRALARRQGFLVPRGFLVASPLRAAPAIGAAASALLRR